MRIHQTIEDYLCIPGSVSKGQTERCKALLKDFSEFSEDCETSLLSPVDFMDYLLEVFASTRARKPGCALEETLQTYVMLRGYAEFLLGKGIFQSEISESNAISNGEMQGIVRFLMLRQ